MAVGVADRKLAQYQAEGTGRTAQSMKSVTTPIVVVSHHNPFCYKQLHLRESIATLKNIFRIFKMGYLLWYCQATELGCGDGTAN